MDDVPAIVSGPKLWPADEPPMEPPPTAHVPVVDIELTSRCNARCSFCPRDETPHQGLMDEATFTAALRRAVEYRDALVTFADRRPGWFDVADGSIWVSFCGMGEPLLHPRVVEYVGRVAEAGLRPAINSNGALLSPPMAEELIAAGLAMACLNVGEVGEAYEETYGLPYERTEANVEHFLQIVPEHCVAVVVLVDHRDDPVHLGQLRDHWTRLGAVPMVFGLINRGGSLEVGWQREVFRAFGDEAEKRLERAGETPRCGIPFLYPFVGYDGHYYLCSSDWRKEVDLGSVFDRALVDLFEEKAERTRSRTPICRGCTHEPTNAMALSLAHAAAGRSTDTFGTFHGEFSARPELMERGFARMSSCVSAMAADLPRSSPDGSSPRRRLIPVRS